MEKNLTPLEKWERMTLADNFIFCKVMEENPEVCKELLEMLLDIKIDRIETPKSDICRIRIKIKRNRFLIAF